jgi:hypothetical protein
MMQRATHTVSHFSKKPIPGVVIALGVSVDMLIRWLSILI